MNFAEGTDNLSATNVDGLEEYSYVEPDRMRIERPTPSNTEQDYTYEESTDLSADNLYEHLPSTYGDDNLQLQENDCYEATMESQNRFVVHENESYQQTNGVPEVHFELNANESYQDIVEMRQNQSYETQPSNVNNPVVANNSESTGLATDNLYEPLPSISGDHINLHENDSYETTLESQGHFVVHENESYQTSGAPEGHFDLNLNESYQNNVNMRGNQSYGVPLSNNENREMHGTHSEFHENQVTIEITEPDHQSASHGNESNNTVAMRENPSYGVPPSTRANQVVVVSQPHSPPRVAVVPPTRAPSTAVLAFAIILTFAMGVQCCFPLFMCVIPGLMLAMLGYSMGSYKKNGHTGRAYNGVSLCCNVTALLLYFYITFTGIVNLLVVYGILYGSRVNTSTRSSSN